MLKVTKFRTKVHPVGYVIVLKCLTVYSNDRPAFFQMASRGQLQLVEKGNLTAQSFLA